jgi:hypothetical protein
MSDNLLIEHKPTCAGNKGLPCNCGAELSVDSKRRLRAFARECIRNSGGDPDAHPGAPSLPCREGE